MPAKRNIIMNLCFICMIVAVALFLYHEYIKVTSPPFWFGGNQLDWEIMHRKTPIGADSISDFIIKECGIEIVPWQRHKIFSFIYSADLRYEWEGDRLLIRFGSGRCSFISDIQIHPPLRCDPFKHPRTSLRSCLNQQDDGKSPNVPLPVFPIVDEQSSEPFPH